VSTTVTPPGAAEDVRPVRRALISVFDKTGLADLVRGFARRRRGAVSTGGSAKLIAGLGTAGHRGRAELTGFPECLEGRVKTLHPMVHAGVLADTRKPEHLEQLTELGVAPFDLVVVNLYPFRATVASGGDPDQVRREHRHRRALDGPGRGQEPPERGRRDRPRGIRPSVLEAVRGGGFTFEQRKLLAAQAFAHTADYDNAVAVVDGQCLRRHLGGHRLPRVDRGDVDEGAGLRYGENPAPARGLYRHWRPGLANAEVLHGKEMSYNNYVDADAAVRGSLDHGDAADGRHHQARQPVRDRCGRERSRRLCGRTLRPGLGLWRESSPPTGPSPRDGAPAQRDLFSEVVAAPDFDDDALEVLREKKNRRLVQSPPLCRGA
jgi:phosphoribosylaminoimidazolecarboxamide formyltransferase/IMP cyclohydrolase